MANPKVGNPEGIRKDEPSFQDIERISYEAPGKMMLAQVL